MGFLMRDKKTNELCIIRPNVGVKRLKRGDRIDMYHMSKGWVPARVEFSEAAGDWFLVGYAQPGRIQPGAIARLSGTSEE